MTRTNPVKVALEQLDDRIMPSTFTGGTSTGLTWAFNDVTNKVVVNGTAGNDQIMLLGNAGGHMYLYDLKGGNFVDTGATLSPTLKIEVNGGAGNDQLQNGIFASFGPAAYKQCVLAGGDGNDLLKAGNGNDMLYGDGGNDCLIGGYGGFGGSATMVGGTGSDTFIPMTPRFNPLGGADKVLDADPDDDAVIDTASLTSVNMNWGSTQSGSLQVSLNNQIVWQSF